MFPIKNLFLKHLLVFFYFLLGAIYITFPLVLNLDTFVPGTVDELYITWIINWNIYSFTHNLSNIFNGNIYFPYEHSLAFSDLHLASSLVAFLPRIISGEPLVSYTFNLVFSFAMLGFCTYLLIFFITKDHLSSIAAATICAFSTYLLPKIGQLQVIAIYWLPLSILSYLAFIKLKKYRYFLLTLLFFYMQFVNSFMPAYFLLFLLLGLTFYEILKSNRKVIFFVNKRNFFAVLTVIIFSIPIIYPYYKVSNTFNYVRDIRETIHTANRPEYFFYNFGRSHIGPIFTSLLYRNPGPVIYDGYRGFANIILTFFVIFFLIKKTKKPKYFSFFSISAILFYILSLGPALQWYGHVIKTPFIIPLPYALLYYLAPGFKGFRNSGRIEIYEILVFCVAGGILLAYLFRKSPIKRYFVALLLSLLVFAEFTFPIKYLSVPDRENIPEIYEYLNNLPDNTIIAEFPIYNWDMAPYSNDENMRLYFSTFHFTRTINGGGGFSPPPWQKDINVLSSNFPNNYSIQRLKEIGVEYLIVHQKEFDSLYSNSFSVNNYRIPNSKMVKSILSNSNDIMFIKSFKNDSLYKIID